jgi:hypothetical protein
VDRRSTHRGKKVRHPPGTLRAVLTGSCSAANPKIAKAQVLS